MLSRRRTDPFTRTLWFMRHGATQLNLDGLRCGGDADVPLTTVGREQVLRAAQLLCARDVGLHAIVCSALERTVQSATIVARVLGGTPIEIDEGFRERRLGGWNYQPVDATEPELRSGVTPPDGEPIDVFEARVLAALHRTAMRHATRRVLVLGSKGIARMLRAALPTSSPNSGSNASSSTIPNSGPNSSTNASSTWQGTEARNAEVLHFDLSALRPSVRDLVEARADLVTP